jgi:phosphonate transport system ATP-binding protein
MSAPAPQVAAHGSTLSVRGLTKEYVRGKPVFTGVDLDVEGAGLTAIIGPSGAGKSTLIRCINRLVAPTSGHILFEGQDLAKARGRTLREARRRIGMVFQEYNLVERLTVMENLLTGRLGYVGTWAAWRRKFSPEDIQRAYGLLDTVGLTEFSHTRADALSGGQRQRVGIARALMQQPRLVLADEPTSSLDPKTAVEIMTLLSDQGRAAGIPVVVNMHDVALARRFAGRVVGMAGGKIVYDGPPEGLDDAMLKTIYGGEGWIH